MSFSFELVRTERQTEEHLSIVPFYQHMEQQEHSFIPSFIHSHIQQYSLSQATSWDYTGEYNSEKVKVSTLQELLF